ncbi:MAG: hypothetical protein PWP38_1453 [Clostridiales bacterium]|jgi:hypothetical protein|nr:hypothetical protein [Clostridiales bacterium]
MTDEEALKKIVNQTKLARRALEADKLEIALDVLSERQVAIESFTAEKHEKTEAVLTILEIFRVENEACMADMIAMKQKQESMMMKTKVQKRDVHYANKVNQKYKMAEAFLVGNTFDSYKKRY